MAWLSLAYKYRRPITLSNSGSSLSDYQTLITLDTASLISAGKMKSDGSDIRFTDDDGTTLLNYWIESGINTSSTKIWVKVPSIPNGSKTIYLYYGNPSATAVSSGDNTFLFFDDFNGSSVDTTKWDIDGYGGYNGIIIDSVNNSVVTFRSDNSWRIMRMIYTFSSSDTGIVEVRASKTADSDWHIGMLVETTNVNYNRLGIIDYYYSGADIGVQKNVNGPYTHPSNFGSMSSNTWYIMRNEKRSNTELAVKFLNNDRSLINQYSATHTEWSNVNWTFVTWQYQPTQVKYDWALIRKYTSTEPTVSVGAETLLPNFFPFL